MNVVKEIGSFNQGRDMARLSLKFWRMRQDAFTFFRGTNHLFQRRFPADELPEKTPLAWLCGDAHIENFGSYKGDNRLTYFDVNDFDDSCLAPAAWDVIRLASSLLVAAPALSLRPDAAEKLAEKLLAAYVDALASGKARVLERDTASGAVGKLLRSLGKRKRPAFLDSRTVHQEGERRLRVCERLDADTLATAKALPASPETRAAVIDAVAGFASTEPQPAFYDVLDVALRIAGTGSLGLPRFVVLVAGAGDSDSNYLLDIKAVRPVPAPMTVNEQPPWTSDAHRATAVQAQFQAAAPALLHTLDIEGAMFALRELQPSEDRLNLALLDPRSEALEAALTTLGQLLAWGHLRCAGWHGAASVDELMAFASKPKWQRRSAKIARWCAAQSVDDWTAFCDAYDDGAFGVERWPAASRSKRAGKQ